MVLEYCHTMVPYMVHVYLLGVRTRVRTRVRTLVRYYVPNGTRLPMVPWYSSTYRVGTMVPLVVLEYHGMAIPDYTNHFVVLVS